MASLQQQEADLEAQIQTYRDQLAIVKEKVSNGAGEELKQLLSDLEQLIDLSEENLIEVKKHKLLLLLQHPRPSAGSDGMMAAPETRTGALPSDGQEGEGRGEIEGGPSNQPPPIDELIGKKCRAPLEESWGGESHHNAVILCQESKPCDPGVSDSAPPESGPPEVRVLFLQPLYPAMKPCSFFLESTCRYSEQECKFSHGHVVPLSKLRPYMEPDYSLAHVGGRCLAMHEDGLWYQAIVSSVGEECVVHFPSLGLTSQLPQEDMMPLESSVECSSASSEGEGEGWSEGEGGEEEEEEVVVVEWRPSGPHSALGEWERHTTGIGSKLLAKMGYVVGQGLGKESQGRVEPVEIVILPAGKSLDVCAKLREAKKVKTVDGLERRKKRKKKKKVLPTVAEEKPTDMFEFLNTKVFSRDKKTETNFLKKSNFKPAKNENLNVQLFSIQEDIKAVNKRRKSLKESLIRHEKRKDKQLADQVKEKLSAVDAQLLQLHRQEHAMQKNITSKSEQKKLSIF